MRSRLTNIFHNSHRRWLAVVLLVLALAGSILSALDILSFSGDFNLLRMVLLAIPAAAGLLCVYGLIRSTRNWPEIQTWISGIVSDPRRLSLVNILLPVLWVILLVTAFLSPEMTGRWSVAYDRVDGLLQLAFLFITTIWIFWFFSTKRFFPEPGSLRQPAVIAGMVLALLILVITLVVALTGKGIGPGTQYWGKSGIPILHWQIGLALIVMLLAAFAVTRKPAGCPVWVVDLAEVAILWLAAFLLWQTAPVSISRYVTAAYPPNYANYPYSDAGDYALEAEMILSGNGFPYGFLDKPLHLSMLAVFTWLAGSDYARMVLIQMGFFALIPGLIYLLVSRMKSRPAGIVGGLIVLFMQFNNLCIAERVQATNVKMAMSESLTAMLLILFGLGLVAWWRNPQRTLLFPALAGALLGLAALVRLNVLVILPFVLFAWIIAFNIRRGRTWLSALVFVLFCLVSLVPWGIRNQIVLNDATESYMSKAYGILFRKRINPIINLIPVTRTPVPAAGQPAATAPEPVAEEPEPAGKWKTLADSMVRTGLHNLVTVGMSLPAGVAHTSLEETIRQPYWDQEWDGSFTPGGQIILAVGLAFVVLGFSLTWKKNGVLALVPLLILLPYLLSNTLSLVSGGRYIIPVDWVLLVYFSIGAAGVVCMVVKLPVPGEEKLSADRAGKQENLLLAGAIFFVILIASLPMGLSLGIPKQYPLLSNAAVLEEIRKLNPSLPEGYTWENLEKLAGQKEATFKVGRAMFPRFMKTGEGDTAGSGSAYSAHPFDHLSFSMISNTKYPFDVLFAMDEPPANLPNSARVIAAGCDTASYLDAFMLVVLDSSPQVYFRKDIQKLACPLPQP